jgi:hypothetical protein
MTGSEKIEECRDSDITVEFERKENRRLHLIGFKGGIKFGRSDDNRQMSRPRFSVGEPV